MSNDYIDIVITARLNVYARYARANDLLSSHESSFFKFGSMNSPRRADRKSVFGSWIHKCITRIRINANDTDYIHLAIWHDDSIHEYDGHVIYLFIAM